MSDYLSRLAARSLNIAEVIYPRVRTFFEPAAWTETAHDVGSLSEQYSLSEKQEVAYKSGKKELYDERNNKSEQAVSFSSDSPSRRSQLEKTGENTEDTIARHRIDLESSLSKGSAALSTSNRSPIQGQSRQDIGDISTPIYRESYLNVRNSDRLSRPISIRNFRNISTHQGKRASGQIEPPEGKILSEGISGKAMNLNSAPLGSESNQRSLDLGGSQQPLHSDIPKPDLPAARSKADDMVHWGVADAQPELQNLIESFVVPQKRENRERIEPNGRTNYPMNKSLKTDVYPQNPSEMELEAISTRPDGIQQQSLPEQLNRIEEENSAKKIKSIPNYASLANTGDILWLAEDSSKRAVSDQSPFSSELRPENVDAEESGRRTSHGPKSISKVTTGRAVQSDSILDGKLEGKRFKATSADNARQEPPRSFEKASPARVDQEIINRQLKGVNPSSRKPPGKSSPSRDQIARSEVAPLAQIIEQSPLQSAKTQSTIRVTIGRVEVRATEPRPASSAPPRRAPPLTHRLSLDEYLKQRSTGQL